MSEDDHTQWLRGVLLLLLDLEFRGRFVVAIVTIIRIVHWHGRWRSLGSEGFEMPCYAIQPN